MLAALLQRTSGQRTSCSSDKTSDDMLASWLCGPSLYLLSVLSCACPSLRRFHLCHPVSLSWYLWLVKLDYTGSEWWLCTYIRQLA